MPMCWRNSPKSDSPRARARERERKKPQKLESSADFGAPTPTSVHSSEGKVVPWCSVHARTYFFVTLLISLSLSLSLSDLPAYLSHCAGFSYVFLTPAITFASISRYVPCSVGCLGGPKFRVTLGIHVSPSRHHGVPGTCTHTQLCHSGVREISKPPYP